MANTKRLIARAGMIFCAVLLSVTTGCAKHENFPAELDVVVPPKPSNFVITNPQNNDYDLSWEISDASKVQNYRLYLVGATIVPELIAEPTTTTFPITLPFDASGLRFGISAVSPDQVEGTMTEADVP